MFGYKLIDGEPIEKASFLMFKSSDYTNGISVGLLEHMIYSDSRLFSAAWYLSSNLNHNVKYLEEFISITGDTYTYYDSKLGLTQEGKVYEVLENIIFNHISQHCILELKIDTYKNVPIIVPNQYIEWFASLHNIDNFCQDKLIIENQKYLDFIKTKRAKIQLDVLYFTPEELDIAMHLSVAYNVTLTDDLLYFDQKYKILDKLYFRREVQIEELLHDTLEVINPTSLLLYDNKHWTADGDILVTEEDGLGFINMFKV